jgi:hypothetical protein
VVEGAPKLAAALRRAEMRGPPHRGSILLAHIYSFHLILHSYMILTRTFKSDEPMNVARLDDSSMNSSMCRSTGG